MTSKEMNKRHGDLSKASYGDFARQEVAIYGTTCEEVELFVKRVRSLFPHLNIGFADADHKKNESVLRGTLWQLQSDSLLLERANSDNTFQRRSDLAHVDLMMVNGSHFAASKQIVIANPKKRDSLMRRAHQLTQVLGIVENENVDGDYLDEMMEVSGLPRITCDEELMSFFESNFFQMPELNALIMAGGKSVRMGKDKTLMRYHKDEQFMHLYKMFLEKNIKPFISCRPDQRAFFEDRGCNVIADRISEMGPLGGIISAFMSFPDNAFFVVACDVPLLSEMELNELIEKRDFSRNATAFISPHDKFPEPLISIWEPKSYPVIMQFVAQGYSCPRKVLINSSCQLVTPANPEHLMNINTQDDLNDLKEMLEQ